MIIKVLASGSFANGYVIENDNEALVLECGCNLLTCEKALHYRLHKVAGCFVTHEHKDHARYIKDYATYMPVYATQGTLQACGCASTVNCKPLAPLKQISVGGFKVLAFPTQHDAIEPCGFLIDHPDLGGSLLFATDTFYLKYKFKNLSYILLECNYDKEKLFSNIASGEVPPSLAKRVQQSHMSLSQCIATLKANNLSNVRGIMLIHLSQSNINAKIALQSVAEATGRYCTIASSGLEFLCL